MKEYTITMNFMIESEEADYEKISEFAEQLTETIMNDDKIIYGNDIEITGVSIEEIENHNPEDEENMYMEDDE